MSNGLSLDHQASEERVAGSQEDQGHVGREGEEWNPPHQRESKGDASDPDHQQVHRA